MTNDKATRSRVSSFPGSAWERTAPEALPRFLANVAHFPSARQAEPALHCVPRQSLGTRRGGQRRTRIGLSPHSRPLSRWERGAAEPGAPRAICNQIWATLLLCILGSPLSAADGPLEALGGRCSTNEAGEVIAVDLSNVWLSDADMEKLARLPRLERIDLSYTKITDLGLEQLAPLAHVKDLNLYYAESVTDLGIAHLNGWKRLERLNVRGTKVSSTLFEYVAKMPALRFLDVGHSRVNDDLFELLEDLPRLEHLSFGGNKMSGVALPLLKSFPALKELSVAGQQRTDSGLWSVSVSDFSIAHIAAIARLEVLDLGNTGITDRGLTELAALKNLRALDLQGTRVTGTGLAALAALPELRSLNLWKTKGIDDSALPALARMAKLESIVLAETGVTAEGLARLADHPRLKNLYLGGTNLKAEQVDALRQAMPGCRISWWEKPVIEYPESGRRSGN